MYRVDPITRQLVDVNARPTMRAVHGAHGVCLYRSRVSGRFYVFAADGAGYVEQFELVAGCLTQPPRPDGKFTGASSRAAVACVPPTDRGGLRCPC